MSAILDAVAAFSASHPHILTLVAFLAAFAEAVAIVGVFVPGSTILVALGALVPLAGASLWPILLAATMGAIAGDGLSYWIGHRYQRAIRAWRTFQRRPELLARGEAFFERHGGKSIILGRFVPPLRPVVPIVAGMAAMPAGRFYAANALSALLWAPAHILPGVLFGATLQFAAAVSLRLTLLVVLTIICFLAFGWLVRLVLRRGIPVARRVLDRFELSAARSRQLPARVLALSLARLRNEVPAVLVLGAVFVAALWAFLKILEDVVTGDPLVRADSAVYHVLQGLRTPGADSLMVAITELGDGIVVGLVALAVLTCLAWQRAWRAAAFWVAVVVVSALFTKGMKLLLYRPRPTLDLSGGAEGFSFPSGHATTNFAIYGFLMVLIFVATGRRWRWPAIAGAAALVAAISVSRLYLGAHWLSDVLGGTVFGAAWISLLGAAYVRRSDASLRAGPLASVAVAALATAGAWHIGGQHAQDLARYAPQRGVRMMTWADWREDGWRSLPPWRVDMIGEIEEPLDLQWVGDPGVLERALGAAGWRQPTSWSFGSGAQWLLPSPDLARLPVIPKLHDGYRPALTLVSEVAGEADRRLVLRLWPSNAVIRGPKGHDWVLWLGNAVTEEFTPLLSVITVARARPMAIVHYGSLVGALPNAILTEAPRDRLPEGSVVLAYDSLALTAELSRRMAPMPGRPDFRTAHAPRAD